MFEDVVHDVLNIYMCMGMSLREGNKIEKVKLCWKIEIKMKKKLNEE